MRTNHGSHKPRPQSQPHSRVKNPCAPGRCRRQDPAKTATSARSGIVTGAAGGQEHGVRRTRECPASALHKSLVVLGCTTVTKKERGRRGRSSKVRRGAANHKPSSAKKGGGPVLHAPALRASAGQSLSAVTSLCHTKGWSWRTVPASPRAPPVSRTQEMARGAPSSPVPQRSRRPLARRQGVRSQADGGDGGSGGSERAGRAGGGGVRHEHHGGERRHQRHRQVVVQHLRSARDTCIHNDHRGGSPGLGARRAQPRSIARCSGGGRGACSLS